MDKAINSEMVRRIGAAGPDGVDEQDLLVCSFDGWELKRVGVCIVDREKPVP